jgi:hypothetical protein
MAFVLIALALLLIIGPILWLQPSPEERRLQALRDHARQLGFRMESLRLDIDPVYGPWQQRNPHLRSLGWMRYRLLPPDGSVVLAEMAWRQRRDKSGALVWDEFPVGAKPPLALEPLLNDWQARQDERFLALESSALSVAFIWDERGDAALLDELAIHLGRYVSAAT